MRFSAVLADLSHPNSWWCSPSATLQGGGMDACITFIHQLRDCHIYIYVYINNLHPPSSLEQRTFLKKQPRRMFTRPWCAPPGIGRGAVGLSPVMMHRLVLLGFPNALEPQPGERFVLQLLHHILTASPRVLVYRLYDSGAPVSLL